MNTVLLQYAVEVEKTGSITQAAANLYMISPISARRSRLWKKALGRLSLNGLPKELCPLPEEGSF